MTFSVNLYCKIFRLRGVVSNKKVRLKYKMSFEGWQIYSITDLLLNNICRYCRCAFYRLLCAGIRNFRDCQINSSLLVWSYNLCPILIDDSNRIWWYDIQEEISRRWRWRSWLIIYSSHVPQQRTTLFAEGFEKTS